MALKAGWMCLEKGAPHRAGRVRALGLVLELGAAAVLAVQTHNQLVACVKVQIHSPKVASLTS